MYEGEFGEGGGEVPAGCFGVGSWCTGHGEATLKLLEVAPTEPKAVPKGVGSEAASPKGAGEGSQGAGGGRGDGVGSGVESPLAAP